MMKIIKGLNPVAEAINRLLDHTDTEQLKEQYHNGGVRAKVEIEDSVIYVLVKAQDQDAGEGEQC